MQTRGGVLSELLVEHVEPGHVQRIRSTQHHRFYCRLALYWRDALRSARDLSARISRAMPDNVRGARPSASAQLPIRTTRSMPVLQRAACTGKVPSSACLLSPDPWRRCSTMAPLDSQPVATILRTERSRQSTTSDEKCHPRPRHRSGQSGDRRRDSKDQVLVGGRPILAQEERRTEHGGSDRVVTFTP